MAGTVAPPGPRALFGQIGGASPVVVIPVLGWLSRRWAALAARAQRASGGVHVGRAVVLLAAGALLLRLLDRSRAARPGAQGAPAEAAASAAKAAAGAGGAEGGAGSAHREAAAGAAPASEAEAQGAAPPEAAARQSLGRAPPAAASGRLEPREFVCDARGRVAGAPELLGTVCASVLGTWAIMLRNRAAAHLVQAQHTQDRGAWIRALLLMPTMMLFHSFSLELFKALRSRLALSWRVNLTKRLHSLYFSNMSYYRLLNGDASVRVENPDVRICTDVLLVCEAWASIPALLINGCVASFILSGDFAQRRGRKAGAVTPAFIFVLIPILLHVAKQFDTTALQLAASAASSRYTQALTHVQLHGERICMLRGERRELELLNGKLDAAVSSQLALERALQGLQLFGLLISGGGGGTSAGSVMHVVGAATASAILVDAAPSPGQPGAGAGAEEAIAKSFGSLFDDQWTMVYSFAAWGSLAASGVVLAAAAGPTRNVIDLYKRLKLVAANASAQRSSAEGGTFKDMGPVISFEDVTVMTPTGHKLLGNLTFTVRQGETLLITGHNGAGKSSIIRCLCNLWQVPCGVIARPGGAVQAEEDLQLHSHIYYLPQRPCNVLGSLSDQLTYPVRPPGGLPEDELRQWLSYVDLEYLLDKRVYSTDDADDSTQNWDELLSIGEQQALSLARLLYHRPRFAILDECTSAVSRTLERRLFVVARALGIACLTIAHRPALKEHHALALRLTGTGLGDARGWSLEALPGPGALPPAPEWCAAAEDAHRRIRGCLDRETAEAGSATRRERQEREASRESSLAWVAARAPADCGALVRARWPSLLSRARAVLDLGLWHAGRRAVLVRVATVLLAVHVQSALTWESMRTTAGGFLAAIRGDGRRVHEEVLCNVLCLPLLAAMEYVVRQQSALLCTELWRGVSLELHRRAFAGGAFFRVMRPSEPHVPFVESPMQRLSDVSANLRGVVGLLIGVLQPAWLFVYLFRVLASGGGMSLTLAPATAAAIYGLLRLVAPNWRSMSVESAELHGRYQVLHTRLHHISEAVAFSGGGSAERSIIERHFDGLAAFESRRLRMQFVFEVLRDFLTSPDKAPEWVRRILVRSYLVHGRMAGGFGSPEAMCASYLYERCVDVAQCLVQQLVNGASEVQKLDAGLQRALELVVAFDAVGSPAAADADVEAAGRSGAGSGRAAIEVQELELVAARCGGGGRGSACLAAGVSFSLEEGTPLMVTGPSSCGKTLLAGVLLGLVPASGGGCRVVLPGAAGVGAARRPSSVLFTAPQHAYLPPGSLGSQVCYPEARALGDEAEDARMREALRRAGLEHVLAREAEGLSATRAWGDVLSGGEQQRLALARVMYHRPRFAILDDCTSMVQSDAEEGLYRALIQDFGVTPLCMSQRLFMPDLFAQELRLGLATESGWCWGRGPLGRASDVPPA